MTAECELPSPSTHVPPFASKSKVRERRSCPGTPDHKGTCRRHPWRCCPALMTSDLNGHRRHLHLGQSRFARHRHSRLLLAEDVHAQNVKMISILLRSFTVLQVIYTIVTRIPAFQSRQASLWFIIVYSTSFFGYVCAIGSYPLL